jgi:hypothetical protein
MDARPPSEIEQIMAVCHTHVVKLYETGHVLIDAGLDNKTKILRRKSGKVLVTDGPFAETKEALGGAFVIEAANLEEAVRLAAIHPTTQVAVGEELGWRLEIHPIHYFKAFEEVFHGQD